MCAWFKLRDLSLFAAFCGASGFFFWHGTKFEMCYDVRKRWQDDQDCCFVIMSLLWKLFLFALGFHWVPFLYIYSARCK